MYPLVFFDALRVKIRDEGLVRNKAVYIALGVMADGTKDILGLWIETSEGAKFWLRVINELKNRGVEDILIAVVDGLKGFPEAITAVFPGTIVQTCIVHLIRHSMDFASWKDRKAIAGELRTIYRAKDAEAGEAALNTFDVGPWGRKYPAIAQSWRRNWAQVIPFFAFPVAVRRIIYTTNAIEALNAKLRRAVKRAAIFQPTKQRSNCSTSSCEMSPRNGKCRRGSGAKPKLNSPLCSTEGSSRHDGQPGPAHEISDSPDRTSAATMRANQLRLWFASMAYVLMCALRRIGLPHTQFAEAACGTIRLKLLKLGALVRVSVRRVKFAMASGCPWQNEWALAHARLRNAAAA